MVAKVFGLNNGEGWRLLHATEDYDCDKKLSEQRSVLKQICEKKSAAKTIHHED